MGKGIDCFFEAEMPEEVVKGKLIAIQMTLSTSIDTESNADRFSSTSSRGGFRAEAGETIYIDIIPTMNFEVIGESTISIDVDDIIDDPIPRYFSVRATSVGAGEVLIIVRLFDQTRLIQIRLRPCILENEPNRIRRSIKQCAQSRIHNDFSFENVGVLEIFERENGNNIFYEYLLNLPDKQKGTFRRGTFTSKYLNRNSEITREKYINNLYEEFEKAYDPNFSILIRNLKAYGCELFEELFPEELQSVLWESRDEIESIIVFSKEPLIPWELIHLRAPGSEGLPKEEKFLAQMGLVRWIDGYNRVVENPPTRITIRGHKSYCVAPDYPGSEDSIWPALQDAQEEAIFLKNKIKASHIKADIGKIFELIESPNQFDLLHFSGHANLADKSISSTSLVIDSDESGENIQTFTVRHVSQMSNFR
ncbi:MAG: hypothetical protein AAFN93_27505, partial [Bacteroidota bacterium]